jgi:hypothetical protein
MMNSTVRFVAILFLMVFTTACNKDGLVHENAFEASYRIWNDFKTTSANSYQYVVVTSSWSGTSTETTITIKNGKPFSRSFVAKAPDQVTNSIVVLDQWQENETTLNSHTNGAAILTLDQVYELAKSEWLLKRKDAVSYFEAKNNGMISNCGYTANNCVDDCFTGITITLIEKR